MTLDVSVVVPARNEEKRLPSSIRRLQSFLDVFRSGELVIAVDVGSTDATAAVAEEFAREDPRIRVVTSAFAGKGAAVRAGIVEARGSVALTADTDLSVDPVHFPSLIDAARRGELAVASRSAPGARRVGEPSGRFLAGRAFNVAVRLMILPGIADSQCGFKAFPRDVGVGLVRQMAVQGWVFDVELLALARRAGIVVREVPVVWQYGHGSTVRLWRDAPSVVRDLVSVRLRLGRPRPPGGPGLVRSPGAA